MIATQATTAIRQDLDFVMFGLTLSGCLLYKVAVSALQTQELHPVPFAQDVDEFYPLNQSLDALVTLGLSNSQLPTVS